ncbi:MAG: hypothetical protein AAF514_17455 [Verrucomicrobiota bacterium]
MLKKALIVIFIILVLAIFQQRSSNARKAEKARAEGTADEIADDLENIPTLFILYSAASVIGAALFATVILPKLGDAASTAVFSSGEKVEEDPYAKAHIRIAQGEYVSAINTFQDIFANQEELERRPIVEIAKLQLEKLEDPEAAAHTLKHALTQRDWEEEDAAFLLGRQAEIVADHLNDKDRSIEILKEIIERFPDTRYSANATHKLKEIDPTLVAKAKPTPTNPEPPKPGGPPRPDV